jgi:hypothetical protein
MSDVQTVWSDGEIDRIQAAGMSARAVMSERLGHSKVGTTLDLYSHVVPEMQEEAAAKLGALVLGS